jgi:hypothetical protein
MSRYGRAALTGVCETIRGACNGSQEITLNNGMLKVAMLIGARELPASAKHAVLEAGLVMPSYDRRRPWTREQIEKKIDHALADGLRKVIRT